MEDYKDEIKPDYKKISKSRREGLPLEDIAKNIGSDESLVKEIETKVADFLGSRKVGRYNDIGVFELITPRQIAETFVKKGRGFFAADLKRLEVEDYMTDARYGGEYRGVSKESALKNYMDLARRLSQTKVK